MLLTIANINDLLSLFHEQDQATVHLPTLRCTGGAG